MRRWWIGLLCALVCPGVARAQATGQLWANATVDWLASERLTYEIDVEPKAQVVTHAGQPSWANVSATPHVEYSLVPWMEVLAEVNVGVTNQSDEVNSTTVAPRVGVQLHLLSQILRSHAQPGAGRERLPKRRLITNTLVRLEHEAPSWRLRDRFAMAYPFNRARTTDDGAVYLTTDAEIFVPLDGAPNGGWFDQLRVRTGAGYRRSFAWRVEALYIWDGKRSGTGALAADYHAVDIRVQHDF